MQTILLRKIGGRFDACWSGMGMPNTLAASGGSGSPLLSVRALLAIFLLPLLLLSAIALLVTFGHAPSLESGSLGLMGFGVMGRTADTMMAELTDAFGKFRESNDKRLNEIAAQVRDVENVSARITQQGGGGARPKAGRPEARAAFARFARTGDEKAMQDFLPEAAMRTSSDPDGGALVTEEFHNDLERLQRDLSPMRRLARIRPVRSDMPQQLVNYGGLASGWVSETQSRPETATDTFGRVSPTMGEVYCCPKITQRELDDSTYDVEDLLTTSIAEEFAVKESGAFVSGDGVEKPRGYLTYPTALTPDATRPFGTLQYVKSGAAGGFAAADPVDRLIDLVTTLRAPYRKGAVWTMNSVTAAAARKLKNPTTGEYIWRDGLELDRPNSMLGYAVEIDEFMPDIAANAYPIAFGNFLRGYLIADHVAGVRVTRDPYTSKPWVNFYTTKRVGGGVTNSEAIKLFKIAA